MNEVTNGIEQSYIGFIYTSLRLMFHLYRNPIFIENELAGFCSSLVDLIGYKAPI